MPKWHWTLFLLFFSFYSHFFVPSRSPTSPRFLAASPPHPHLLNGFKTFQHWREDQLHCGANQEKWTRTCQGDATYDPVSSSSPLHLLLLSPHPNLTQWLGMLGCLLLLLDMLHRSPRNPRNARRAFVCKGLQPPFKFFMNGWLVSKGENLIGGKNHPLKKIGKRKERGGVGWGKTLASKAAVTGFMTHRGNNSIPCSSSFSWPPFPECHLINCRG